MAQRDQLITRLQNEVRELNNMVFFINPNSGSKMPGKDKHSLLFQYFEQITACKSSQEKHKV
jgi:hypothetical protein